MLLIDNNLLLPGAKLTDSEIKRNRSEVSSKLNKCRIYVRDQLTVAVGWSELNEVLRVKSPEIDNNFGYEKITQLVDNIPLRHEINRFMAHYE
jgi:hypothetical protein